MSVSYSRPFGSAWERMKGLLFRPFDLGLWFVLGFTAWLASLVGGDLRSPDTEIQQRIDPDGDFAWSNLSGTASERIQDLLADSVMFVLVICLVVLALALWIAVTWVGSRGQFMFLDNLVHRRTEVARPWSEFAREGNSLFLWQLVYAVLVGVVVGGLVLAGTMTVIALAAADFPALPSIPVFVGLGVLAFVIVVVLAYIQFFLLHAVVPIMHRHRLGTTAAWGRFLALFRRDPTPWVLFGLYQLLIGAVAGVIFLVAGLLTCCVGWLLLVIPYVGTVVTLPLPVLVRYLDLEFLRQFGPEFDLLGPAEDEPSGDLDGDGAVVRAEDVGPDAGGPQSGPQDS